MIIKKIKAKVETPNGTDEKYVQSEQGAKKFAKHRNCDLLITISSKLDTDNKTKTIKIKHWIFNGIRWKQNIEQTTKQVMKL